MTPSIACSQRPCCARRRRGYDAAGAHLSTYSLHGRLQRIAIDRPTSRHNFRIIATGTDDDAGAIFGIHKTLATVLVLDSKGKQLWKGVLLPAAERIARFEVVSRDKYSREIILLTREGHEVHLDFEGNLSAKPPHGVTLKILPRHVRAS